MKSIRTNINLDLKQLGIEIDDRSEFVLVESGFDVEPGFINIVFKNPLDIPRLLTSANYYKSKNHLLGKKDEDHHLIQVRDVIYIEGINNDTYVYTKDNSYLIKDKLYELEKSLHDKKFVRVSKSFMVSINHIDKIKPTFNGKLLLKLSNGQSLEVSRHYIKSFRNYLGF